MLPLAACASSSTTFSLAEAETWARARREVTVHFADGSSVRVRDVHLRPDTSWGFVPAEGVVRRWPTADARRFDTHDRRHGTRLGLPVGAATGAAIGVVRERRCRARSEGGFMPCFGESLEPYILFTLGGLLGAGLDAGTDRGETLHLRWRPDGGADTLRDGR